jgi:hypothetical protein
MSKVILDLCGGTGAWSKPYKENGYDVKNITLPHYNVLDVELTKFKRGVFETNPMWCKYFIFKGYRINDVKVRVNDIYGVLAAPPCAEFSKASWNKKWIDRDFKKGMETVTACLEIIWNIQINSHKLKFWALENPMGYLYNFLGKPAFYFQPWQFGDKTFLATKRTALWGYFNQPVKIVRKRNVPYIRNPKNTKSTNSNPGWQVNKEKRAITPPGFAKAFFNANQ